MSPPPVCEAPLSAAERLTTSSAAIAGIGPIASTIRAAPTMPYILRLRIFSLFIAILPMPESPLFYARLRPDNTPSQALPKWRIGGSILGRVDSTGVQIGGNPRFDSG